jgi:hypothetical protein
LSDLTLEQTWRYFGVSGPDDYIVLDGRRRAIGRIMLQPRGPEGRPWFWTITAKEKPPSVYNEGYSATREQAMADFKKQWSN